jgi:hypothetical protein
MNFNVSSGHEPEAREAEAAKTPNRFGMWILKVLGYKGKSDSGQ